MHLRLRITQKKTDIFIFHFFKGVNYSFSIYFLNAILETKDTSLENMRGFFTAVNSVFKNGSINYKFGGLCSNV